MAGNDDNNDLSMDLINFEEVEIPDEVVQVEQEEEQKNITDDGSQEIVGDSTEESSIEEKTDGTNDETPADSDDNVFKSFAAFLGEKGLLSVQEEDFAKIETDEDFAELMRKQIKENELADLNDNQKKYLEALREGVPDQMIHEYLQAAEAYEQLTDDYVRSNPEIQKDLIVEGWKAQGFDEDYALKQFHRVSDTEKFEESIMFREKLKQQRDQVLSSKIEENKKAEEQAENARKQQLEDLKQSVYTKEKLFDELNVSKGMKEKVYNLMTRPVSYTEDGQPVNALIKHQLDDPIGFQTSLYYIYDLTNGFKDIKNLTARATSKAVNTFKSKLQKSNFIMNSSGNPELVDGTNAEMPDIVDIE